MSLKTANLQVHKNLFQNETDLGRERSFPELPGELRLQLRQRVPLQRHLRQELRPPGRESEAEA